MSTSQAPAQTTTALHKLTAAAARSSNQTEDNGALHVERRGGCGGGAGRWYDRVDGDGSPADKGAAGVPAPGYSCAGARGLRRGRKRLVLVRRRRDGLRGRRVPVSEGEELRPGQIYFVLPAEARRNGLRREDIAALAVRASAALVKKASTAGCSGRRRRAGSVSPLVFAPPAEKVDHTASYKTVPALAAKRRQMARAKSAGRMQPRFAPDLSAIPECDTTE